MKIWYLSGPDKYQKNVWTEKPDYLDQILIWTKFAHVCSFSIISANSIFIRFKMICILCIRPFSLTTRWRQIEIFLRSCFRAHLTEDACKFWFENINRPYDFQILLKSCTITLCIATLETPHFSSGFEISKSVDSCPKIFRKRGP